MLSGDLIAVRCGNPLKHTYYGQNVFLNVEVGSTSSNHYAL